MNELRRGMLVVTLLLAWTGVASAQPVAAGAALDMSRFRLFCPNAITQNFPTSGPAETTWLICWGEVAGSDSVANPNGLVIGPVYFRKSPSAPFIRILWDMRVSDYFVPYHPGSPAVLRSEYLQFRTDRCNRARLSR